MNNCIVLPNCNGGNLVIVSSKIESLNPIVKSWNDITSLDDHSIDHFDEHHDCSLDVWNQIWIITMDKKFELRGHALLHDYNRPSIALELNWRYMLAKTLLPIDPFLKRNNMVVVNNIMVGTTNLQRIVEVKPIRYQEYWKHVVQTIHFFGGIKVQPGTADSLLSG